MSNALDETLLVPWLEEHVAGFAGFHALEKFGDGQSNPTYKVTAESGTYALRAKPPGELCLGQAQPLPDFSQPGACKHLPCHLRTFAKNLRNHTSLRTRNEQ